MSSVLYYSNHCSSSKEVINRFSRSKIKDDIHFVCVDRRIKDQFGRTFVVLENENRIILPDIVTQVPTVIKLNEDNKIYSGAKEILDHFNPREEEINLESTGNQGEPTAFSMTEMAGDSDAYSYLNMTFDELSAKGTGGTRMMHSFATPEGVLTIDTPSEDYVPDKIGEVSLDKLETERNNDMTTIKNNLSL
jgi:hypothetical protein